MRVESSLSIKESMRLEAALGGVGEALASWLIAAYACPIATEYVTRLTLEPPMIMFIVLLGVGSAGWSASRASLIASVFLPLSESKSWI